MSGIDDAREGTASPFAGVCVSKIKGGRKMNKNICKAMLFRVVLVGLVLSLPIRAEALEPKLLWKKEFKDEVNSVGLAKETGEVIVGTSESSQVILYDKNGNERFHWGPRADRGAYDVRISKDGKYFVFMSGYKWEYAVKIGVNYWEDDSLHFYNGQTKKELWNSAQPENHPTLAPDGQSVLFTSAYDGFSYYNFSGEEIVISDIGQEVAFSPEGGYFVVSGETHEIPLMLFKRDGTKLWERGKHSTIASISEGASYISTYPYGLGHRSPDSQNSHLGTVYDKNGNKVLEGLGIVSGNGAKIAMYSPGKFTILSLPDKAILKEIPIDYKVSRNMHAFIAAFSYDGRYLILKKGNTLFIFDLVDNIRKDFIILMLGNDPKVLFTANGKYLLTFSREINYKKAVYYYQLY